MPISSRMVNGEFYFDGASGPHLHSFLTATQQPSVRQFQGFLCFGTLLTVVLQSAELALVDGKGLKGLFWTKASLQTGIQNCYQGGNNKIKTAQPKTIPLQTLPEVILKRQHFRVKLNANATTYCNRLGLLPVC